MTYKVFVDGKFDQYYSAAMTGAAGWIKATGPNTVEIHESGAPGSAVVKTGTFLTQKWAVFYYSPEGLTNTGHIYDTVDAAQVAFIKWDQNVCFKSHIQEIWV